MRSHSAPRTFSWWLLCLVSLCTSLPLQVSCFVLSSVFEYLSKSEKKKENLLLDQRV